jgi:diphosphomevalonate decarboxylase
MHAVMMTSHPDLYLLGSCDPGCDASVQAWRTQGYPACFTIDAGPNVHVICLTNVVSAVTRRLQEIPGVLRVSPAHPGGRRG